MGTEAPDHLLSLLPKIYPSLIDILAQVWKTIGVSVWESGYSRNTGQPFHLFHTILPLCVQLEAARRQRCFAVKLARVRNGQTKTFSASFK